VPGPSIGDGVSDTCPSVKHIFERHQETIATYQQQVSVLIDPFLASARPPDLIQQVWVSIRIRDNGPGLKPEVVEKLFDPFFTTKAVGKGPGLGLSISYQMITEKHGGKLACDSRLNNGTEFVIEIPLKQAIT
jgi:signal transduction histidine kinase